jgi:two-component system OmpR family sensor kinase
VASWFIARAALQPIETFTAAAEAIDSTDLGRRLPEPSGRRNEFTRLAHTFNRLLERLQSAFGDRERALEEQRRFTQDASHELRTPLTSVLGYTRILRTWGKDNPEVTAESVAAIEREAQRMHTLVERLLALARGDADAWLERRPTDLRELAHLAIDAAVTADGGLHPISLDAADDPVIVPVEPDLIRQVLDILLENATHYTPAGRPVEVTVARDETSAIVTVRDHGDGIPEAELPHLFERFYRGETSRDRPGTGLGLAIAHSIASRHGGTLTATSGPQGSTFTLTLPN